MRKGRQATVLTTLVFTDIVASTAMAEEMGDRRWRELLERGEDGQRAANCPGRPVVSIRAVSVRRL